MTSQSQSKTDALLTQPSAKKGTQKKALAPKQVKGAFSSGSTLPAELKSAQQQSQSEVLVRLTLAQMPKPFHFEAGVGKDAQIAKWLMQWIQNGFETKSLNENYLLPLKQELSGYLGVSIGTVQNAIRFVEDEGWVESKQRIGTLLRNASQDHDEQRIRKQTSKRDQAVLAIQQYIVNESLEVNQILPSSRELSKIIHSAPNTTRLAMEFLANEGILEAMGNRGKKPNWTLRRIPNVEHVGTDFASIQTDTLIDQVERDLKQLISDEYEVNDTLPPHQELALRFKVSIKTVHDAMQRLAEQGMIHSKRGRYGTYVTRLPLHLNRLSDMEFLFVPAEQHVDLYDYEKAYNALSEKLTHTFKSGEQLPSIQSLAEEIGVTVNSVRRGLKQLEDAGKVTFKRGRYGGTFVV